jgi:hypothetical protein
MILKKREKKQLKPEEIVKDTKKLLASPKKIMKHSKSQENLK